MRRDGNSYLLIANIPIIISIIAIVLLECYKGESEMQGYLGIIIALIGVIGSILVTALQLKKDTRAIEEVKKDTVVMKPTTDNIFMLTQKTNETVRENMKQNLENLIKTTEKDIVPIIAEIRENARFEKQLREKYSTTNKDTIISSVNSLFQENAKLKTDIVTLIEEKKLIENKYIELKAQFDKFIEEKQDISF